MESNFYKTLTKAILAVLMLMGIAALNSFALAGNDSTASTGENFFQSLACGGCHAINGQGSKEGPDLTSVGKYFSRQELELKLKMPRSLRKDSPMPSFAFVQPQELQKLLDFLQCPN
jgi:cytochrome c2